MVQNKYDVKCYAISVFCFQRDNGVVIRKYHKECIKHYFSMYLYFYNLMYY